MTNWFLQFHKFNDGPGNYVEYIPVRVVKWLPEIKWIECGSPLSEGKSNTT